VRIEALLRAKSHKGGYHPLFDASLFELFSWNAPSVPGPQAEIVVMVEFAHTNS
jgi:hypothetical protein